MDRMDSEIRNGSRSIAVKRIVALWALSETTFGGILHALHIPLTGIFIGGAAVIFITLIAYFSEAKVSLIKATIIVLIVKGIVSPHTPIAAYFAVLLQGVLGQILFRNKTHLSLSAFILSVTTLFFFGFQKILIFTIVFGNTLWESLDVYVNFIINQFKITPQNEHSIQFSLILISAYMLMHLIAGIVIGIIAGRIPKFISQSLIKNDYAIIKINRAAESDYSTAEKRIRKNSGKIIWRSLFFAGLGGIILFTYLIPDFGSGLAYNVSLMLLRAVTITLLWYFYLAPLLKKFSSRLLKKHQNIYAEEVEEIINLLPRLKYIISHCWTKSSELKGFHKYRTFVGYSFTSMLITNYNYD
jgi:hypothetical protein